MARSVLQCVNKGQDSTRFGRERPGSALMFHGKLQFKHQLIAFLRERFHAPPKRHHGSTRLIDSTSPLCIGA